jgi:Type VI secretion system (T6SS), amidase effector protein 4
MNMSVDFQTLWDAYPLGDQQAFFDRLAGGWPQLVGKENYKNTCALRMTVALRGCGETVPKPLAQADGNLKDGSGQSLLIRVASMKAWLEELWGDSSWAINKQIGADIEGLIPKGKRGILLYRVPNGKDASGHVDIWDGTTCRNDCHSEFARSATEVELWYL